MYKKKASRKWQNVKIPASKKSWTVDALTNSTAYEFKIAGTTVGGIGSYTDVVVVTTGGKYWSHSVRPRSHYRLT